jgi:EF hand
MKKVLTVIAMVLTAGAAMAGDTDKMSFKQLDANADGQISAAEASGSTQLSQSLKDIDTNGDGSVSQSEYDAWAAGSARGSTSDQPKPDKQ